MLGVIVEKDPMGRGEMSGMKMGLILYTQLYIYKCNFGGLSGFDSIFSIQ